MVQYIIEGRRYRLDGAIDDGLVSRCGVNTKTFDPSMTVAALECAALQRCSFLLSIKVRTPCTGHSVRGDFFLLFLLACLCELHRIRIVQAEMGLAGSRTSFSFPPNRKPSFLSAIFCICHHVCPLVHPILPVTAFGWQFLTVAACSWSRFFFWVILQALPLFGTTLFTWRAAGCGGLHPG